MKQFLKNNWLTIISLFATTISDIILNVTTTVSLFENLILGLLILIIVTILIETNKKLINIYDNTEKHLHRLLFEEVYSFSSVKDMANHMNELLKNGEHTIKFLSLDQKIRTENNDKEFMIKLVKKLEESKNITFQYIFNLTNKESNSFQKKDYQQLRIKNTYFGYSSNKIPFASFFIIDNIYLSIRSPHKMGMEKKYCWIKNEDIVKLFSNWFSMLWDECNKIETEKDIDDLNKLMSGKEEKK